MSDYKNLQKLELFLQINTFLGAARFLIFFLIYASILLNNIVLLNHYNNHFFNIHIFFFAVVVVEVVEGVGQGGKRLFHWLITRFDNMNP